MAARACAGSLLAPLQVLPLGLAGLAVARALSAVAALDRDGLSNRPVPRSRRLGRTWRSAAFTAMTWSTTVT
ncbi:hypothetical protein [Nocardia salmonicida]|uniref:hypothetical protein n=1 Tax=Nocardia salmonicida TaxID=53431 RepID=UPI00340D0170